MNPNEDEPVVAPPGRIGPVGLIMVACLAVTIGVDSAHRRRWLALMGTMALTSVIHVGAMAGASRLAGLARERIAFFLGGAILRRFAGSTWWCVGWLFAGGYVKFPATAKELRGPGISWDAAGAGAKVLVSLSGCAALLALSFSLLGWHDAVAAIAAAPGQMLAIASRSTMGRPIVELLDGPSFAVALGVVAAKLGVLNLLPLPIFNGGQSLIYAVEGVTRRQVPQRWLVLGQVLSLTVMLTVFAMLLFAIGRAWRG